MTAAQLATPDVEEIAAEAHAFLSSRVPRKSATRRGWGEGDDAVMGLATAHGDEERREIEAAKAWQAALFDAGLAWIDGPVEYGGRGLGPEHTRAVRRAISQYQVPPTGCFMVNFEIVGPTVLEHGTPEQKEKWLRRIWRGDIICCQMFSEPEAGSDLASLRATARPKDDGTWVVRGQKVWSSGAHYSQLGELLARTGTAEDRHRGITAFLVEMDRPGIDIRPLRQITGSEHFNEVFFDDVELPDSDRLGEVNGGWLVASTGLGGERSVMGDEDTVILVDPVRRLFGLAEHLGVADDPAVAELLGEAWAREQILAVTGRRLAAADGPPGSIAKLQMIGNTEFYISVATRLLGHRLAVDTGEWGTYSWNEVVLGAPAHRIAGGTDEIQRNIIAERLLGLPREARPAPKAST